MYFLILCQLTFTFALPKSGSGSGSSIIGSNNIQQCPVSTCTAFDMNNPKSKNKCIRTDGTTGCIISSIWSGNILVYCTPDIIRYPKFTNGC